MIRSCTLYLDFLPTDLEVWPTLQKLCPGLWPLNQKSNDVWPTFLKLLPWSSLPEKKNNFPKPVVQPSKFSNISFLFNTCTSIFSGPANILLAWVFRSLGFPGRLLVITSELREKGLSYFTCALWQDLSHHTIIFDLMTFTLTYFLIITFEPG